MSWETAYETANKRHFLNPITPGQCGGMCALWLSNMYKRSSMGSLDDTNPEKKELKIPLPTWDDPNPKSKKKSAVPYPTVFALQYAGLRAPVWSIKPQVPAPDREPYKFPLRPGQIDPDFLFPAEPLAAPAAPPGNSELDKFPYRFHGPDRKTDDNTIQQQTAWRLVQEANQRYVAAAGLKPGPVKRNVYTSLGDLLARTSASGGNFIDIGGHAVATFVTWGTTLASYEKKTGKPRRLYYFDPNNGCFFSDNELSFRAIFGDVYEEHKKKGNVDLTDDWHYFQVDDVSEQTTSPSSNDDSDMDISSLFKERA